ncbi:aminotransferase class V-fold PLP-dependent enzyme [Candidatus Bipolaricaulota bacterium]
MSEKLMIDTVRRAVVGVEEHVNLLDGSRHPYINFDNASSTPTLVPVLRRVNDFMQFYASVGRGSGYKSHVASEEFESARTTIGAFVGARPQSHVVILGKNTTEAVNKLAHRFPFSPGDIVLTSLMEHHSNDLPWRQVADVRFIAVREDGTLDLEDLEIKLKENRGRVKLVAITGASNVTGILNPIGVIARLAHEAGARFAVDAAQLAPHRAIDMGDPADPEHIDCLVYTGHKMYAPFGIGALVTLRDCLRNDGPDLVGGGTVDFVTEHDVHWSGLPNREEAGTPNVVGAVAWAEAIRCLQDIGMASIAAHESKLADLLLKSLAGIPKARVFGVEDLGKAADQLGVVTFAIEGVHHKLVSAILGYEGGIGVRSGLFCAHPYVLRLLQITELKQSQIADALSQEGIAALPGLTRASFGIYNNEAEVERAVEMLMTIAEGNQRGEYRRDPASGDFSPVGFAWPKLGTDYPPLKGC